MDNSSDHNTQKNHSRRDLLKLAGAASALGTNNLAQAQAPSALAPQPEERTRVPEAVPPNEGNEVRRDEQRGVGALHCTEEAGEPPRGTPWRESGAGTRKRWRER